MPDYNEIVREILAHNTLMTIATVKEGKPWASTAFYSFTKELDLIFLSDPTARHCLNIANNDAVAVSIYDSTTVWGQDIRGLQIEGTAQGVPLLKAAKLFASYLDRFVVAQKCFPSVETLFSKFESRPYLIKPTNIKIFDEKNFGPEGTVDYKIG